MTIAQYSLIGSMVVLGGVVVFKIVQNMNKQDKLAAKGTGSKPKPAPVVIPIPIPKPEPKKEEPKDEDEYCVKCGYFRDLTIHGKWSATKFVRDDNGEHLDVTCWMCGFTYPLSCWDAK